jgi:hypothetical protein
MLVPHSDGGRLHRRRTNVERAAVGTVVRLGILITALGASASLAQEAPPALIAAVQAHAEKAGVRQVVRMRHVLADLNGDGIDDAVVLLRDPDWSGTGGCTLLVLRGDKRGYSVVSASSVTELPIRIAPERAHGWKTLIVHSAGRGDVLMRFDGKRYPANPSLLPIASATQLRGAAVVIR